MTRPSTSLAVLYTANALRRHRVPELTAKTPKMARVATADMVFCAAGANLRVHTLCATLRARTASLEKRIVQLTLSARAALPVDHVQSWTADCAFTLDDCQAACNVIVLAYIGLTVCALEFYSLLSVPQFFVEYLAPNTSYIYRPDFYKSRTGLRICSKIRL